MDPRQCNTELPGQGIFFSVGDLGVTGADFGVLFEPGSESATGSYPVNHTVESFPLNPDGKFVAVFSPTS